MELERLRTENARLRLLCTNAPAILAHWSRDHRLLFGSLAFAERWNVPPDSLVGRTVAEVIGEEGWATIRPYVERVVAGEAVDFEREIVYKDIGPRFVRVSYRPERDAQGVVQGYFSAVTDISDRRRAEAAQRESDERLRMATQTGKLGLWDWDIARNRLTWTDSLYEVHGVARESFEPTFEGFASLLHPDDRERVQRSVEACLAGTDHYELEFRAIRPDGETIWVFTNALVLREAGRPVRMSGATLDVTDRKRAEIALRESEEKFRALASRAPVGIYMTGPAGDCRFVNHAWEVMSGLTAEEAAGSGWMEALHPDDRARIGVAWEAARQTAKRFAAEFRYLRPDGKVAWVQSSAEEFRDAGGTTLGYIGTAVEITERKTAEFALRESEKRFRSLANRAPVGIFMTDPQGETVFVNETWCTMAGVGAADAQGSGWLNIVHPDDRARLAAGWQEAVRNGVTSDAEYRFVRPDGSVTWVQGSAVQLRDASGRLAGYVGTIADFTQRKLAEIALRESEERYRRSAEGLNLALAASNLGNWSWDRVTDELSLSPRAAEILGTPVGSRPTWTSLRQRLHEDDRARDLAAVQRAVETKSDYDIEVRLRAAAGGWNWVAVKARGVYAEDDTVTGMIGVVQDVTARKVADETLRAQAAQLRLITTNAPIILAHCDRQGRYLFVNRAYAERFQRRPEDFVGRTIAEALGPEAFSTLVPYVKRVLAGESIDYEVEVPYAGLGRRYMKVSYVPDIADDGTVRGWLSAISDLTERRRVEEALRASEAALRRSEERYRQLVQVLPVAVYTCDASGRIDLYNEAAVALWGREPVRGMERWSGAHRAFYPDGTPVVVEQGAVATALREGRPIPSFEVIVERPDGERRHVLANPHPIHDDAGNVVGAVNALIDVTAHKRAEQNAGFLSHLSQQLAAVSEPAAIIETAARTIGEHLGVQRCGFVERGPETGSIRALSGWQRPGLAGLEGDYRMAEFGLPESWASLAADRLGIEDVARHLLTRDFAGSYAGLGMQALAIAPFVRDGRWVALLAVTQEQPRAWSPDEMVLLENAVTRVWPLVERARVEGDLRAAQEQLQAHAQNLERMVEQRTTSLREAISQMEEFSYSVSHDLRSPLRAMNAYAEVLLEDYGPQLDDTARNYLQRIQRSSVRMDRLTHDVLTYSRLARADIQLTPVRLENILRDLVDQYAELQPAAADVTINSPLLPVLAHEPSLGQCLGNLLTNAAKFVRPGERPRIRVQTRLVDGRVRILIEDNGIGIPPQYHAALFQVFERVPTRAHYEGTGIGLAIVRKAAEKMGGRAGVDSDGEHGSCFWVELKRVLA